MEGYREMLLADRYRGPGQLLRHQVHGRRHPGQQRTLEPWPASLLWLGPFAPHHGLQPGLH